MSGNKSGADDARWEILRCLYAGEASVLPLNPSEIALIAGCSNEDVHRRIANWVVPGRNPLSQAQGNVTEFRKKGTALARQTLEVISREMDELVRTKQEDAALDTKLKILLALTRSFQSLEEMINRMEKAIVDDDRYPSDVLEFRRELEKYIQTLGENGASS